MDLRLNSQLGIFIPRRKAQKALELMRSLGLSLTGFGLLSDSESIGIPISHLPSSQETEVMTRELGPFEVHSAFFKQTPLKPRNLREAASGTLPPNLVSRLPKSLDIIGDIAIVEISQILEPYSAEVGRAVMRTNPHVRLVLKKSGDVDGKFRTRKLQALAGSGETETVYSEFGCRYRLDVSSVYFNPRLGRERRRVAEQVQPEEVIVDMFAGVGPYSILIAKLQPNSRVYSSDINPSAIQYLKENILMNRSADRVTPLLGDVREFSRARLTDTADRVVMNLPSEAKRYLDAALQILKQKGGIVHYYEFVDRTTDINRVRDEFQASVLAQKRNVRNFTFAKAIKEIAPNRVQVAIDATIT